MRELTAKVILDVTGGEARGALPAAELTAVTTDSRTITPGCLFAAIPGERVNGHDFIPQAAEKGASCVLCERFVEADIPQIAVPDTQAALRAIAAWYRGRFDIPFIGVTGSVGKTTAKEMIASVLSARYDTLKTEKNFNNDLGVPLTLFRLREEHQAAVVEMGISRCCVRTISPAGPCSSAWVSTVPSGRWISPPAGRRPCAAPSWPGTGASRCVSPLSATTWYTPR